MIRKAGECDISQIAACEACCFPLPLSARAIADMLKNPLYLFLVAEDQGTFAGHAAILFTGETAEILSVAVLPAFREKGLATKLLEETEKQTFRNDAVEMLLEVRISNIPAIRLYEKYGFEKIALRKNFYSAPPEDGITMRKGIKLP